MLFKIGDVLLLFWGKEVLVLLFILLNCVKLLLLVELILLGLKFVELLNVNCRNCWGKGLCFGLIILRLDEFKFIRVGRGLFLGIVFRIKDFVFVILLFDCREVILLLRGFIIFRCDIIGFGVIVGGGIVGNIGLLSIFRFCAVVVVDNNLFLIGEEFIDDEICECNVDFEDIFLFIFRLRFILELFRLRIWFCIVWIWLINCVIVVIKFLFCLSIWFSWFC